MNKMIFIQIEDFDLSNIPENCRDKKSDRFKNAVANYIEKDYGNSGVFVTVEVDNKTILVTENKKLTENLELAIESLQKGNPRKGKNILGELLEQKPENSIILYNLGMIYSDEGNLSQAIKYLTQATKLNHDHAHAWVALAVAHMRNNDIELATEAANTAVQVDPEDSYVLRTSGTLLAKTGNNEGALIILEISAKKSPNDSITLYSLAESLRVRGTPDDNKRADDLYQKVIDLDPGSVQAERAKDRRREFAYKGFRKVAELRPDAVMYCLDALNKFNTMTPQEIGGVAMETATLGQSGLEVNNPDKTYQLRTIPGNYSGLNVVCILHTAIQKVAPGNDSGFDVQAEYEEALKLFDHKK